MPKRDRIPEMTKLIMKTLLLIQAFILLVLLTGCGQKGPLYLPENRSNTPDIDSSQMADRQNEDEKEPESNSE